MKRVVFYGSSDDLIEVEGDLPGCDEYNGERKGFKVAGLRVGVLYVSPGVWAIMVAQQDEDEPMLAEDLRLDVAPRYGGEPGYSMRLSMMVPDDTVIVTEEDETS